MAKANRRSERREGALSRERIVAAAISLLDELGEDGLIFRELAARLATGAGAIYWHVANKSELLVAATNAIVTHAIGDARDFGSAREAIRSVSVGVFDAIDAHPWVGTQLSRSPWPTATLRIFELIGRRIEALGGAEAGYFTSASALVSYILGVSVQNAAQGRLLEQPVNRAHVLEAESARWRNLDAHEYPFLRKVAAQLRAHDDRAEFLAGIDLILAGIEASVGRVPGPPSPASRRRRAPASRQ